MEEQLELKRKHRSKGGEIWFKRSMMIVIITVVLVTLFVFFAGRAIANVAPEDVGYSIYEGLIRDGHSFWASFLFGDKYASLPRELTGTVNSVPDGISVLFKDDNSSYKGGGFLTVTPDGCNGRLIAIKNPNRFSFAISTQQSNTLSALMSLSGAQGIFATRDSESDSPLIINGAWASEKADESFTYIGFTKEGILDFGKATKEELLEKELRLAAEQEVYTLISGGVPQGFDLKDIPLNVPSVSIGQCADGSVLVLLLDGDSSCRDAMEIMYKYNAVNAAVIYLGSDGAFIPKDAQAGSYMSDGSAEDAHYHITWIFR